jgi:SSS family transporter
MTRDLAAVDVAIVAVCVLGTTLLGAWFGRRQRGLNSYFVGDRNVRWWLVLISIVATETSTVTFLSIPGKAFDPQDGDLRFLQLAFGYVIGRMLIAWFLLPQYMRGDLLSAYQLLRQRFNAAVQRTASGLFLITRAVADGLRLYLASLLLQSCTGWDSQVSVLVIGGATMVYTYLGGMQAVIWTDLLQFIVYIAGAIIAALCILRLLPGGVEEFVAVGESHHRFHLFDWAFDPSRVYTVWAGLIGGAFFTMASHGADQMMVQRYLCVRSLGQARTALILSGLVVLLQFTLFLLIGVGLYVLSVEGRLTFTGEPKNDEVFGLFIIGYLPRGIVGIVLAAVLAASMATLSSSLNSSASAFMADFYRPLTSSRPESHYLWVSRLMTAVWGLTRIAVAMTAVELQSGKSVVDQVLAVAGFTTGTVLGLFILGSMRTPVASYAALVGMLAGLLTVLLVWLPSVWGRALFAWPWYAPIGTIVTVTAAWAINPWIKNRGPLDNRGS